MTETIIVGDDGRGRCAWGATDAEYRRYHDEEWGFPLHGDVPLFEKLSLEAFQSGLSWITILRRRPGFRSAFSGFEPAIVAEFTETDVERLMLDAGIIRNRAKIVATISNARIVRDLVADDPGALDRLVWSFAPDTADRASSDRAGSDRAGADCDTAALDTADRGIADRGTATRTRPAAWGDVPAITAESTALSSALKKLGLRFVGPTTAYALMQSGGLVDDHLVGCWRADTAA